MADKESNPARGRRFKKRYLVLALLIGFLAYSYTWTNTAYGKLDWRAAFTLRTLTFAVPIEHGETRKQTIAIPINILFALSPLLPAEDVQSTRDIKIPGKAGAIPARVYWPKGYDKANPAPPVIVYFHGGGFVTGSVDLFDQLTRSIANSAGAIVVSVHYRLAPDHPWPAGPDDAYAATVWAAQNAAALGGDPSRIVVGGDSAGGNLAAVTALRARDSNGPRLAGQLLYYPVVDLSATRYPSQAKFQDGYGLSSEGGAGFQKAYLGQLTMQQRADPYVSPIKASSLEGLPPVLLVTGGFDPLTDGSRAYAARLRQAGVIVEHRNYSDIIHGFMSVPFFSQRREALDLTADWAKTIAPAGVVPPAAATEPKPS
jgi:acetyl esterase